MTNNSDVLFEKRGLKCTYIIIFVMIKLNIKLNIKHKIVISITFKLYVAPEANRVGGNRKRS